MGKVPEYKPIINCSHHLPPKYQGLRTWTKGPRGRPGGPKDQRAWGTRDHKSTSNAKRVWKVWFLIANMCFCLNTEQFVVC